MGDRSGRQARKGLGLRVLVVSLAVVLLVGGGIVGWYGYATRAQGNPQAVEFSEAVISPELSEATVLALGEATHGNAEFQRLRLQLLQELPWFRAIAFEEDYGSVAQVNEYVQGGPGTAVEAAQRFGFVLNHTVEMADLLRWIRGHNEDIPAEERIQLVGIDVQRVEANQQIALDWLAQHRRAAADRLRQQLAGWGDESNLGAEGEQRRTEVGSAVEQLVAEIESLDHASEGWGEARNAATTLAQHLELKAANDYAATRAEIMAENLERTVAEQAERGNDHTLLFSHNGHVDKSSAAYRHADLGERAAERWGDGYRVIGTDLTRATLVTGERERRWQVTMVNRSPLRGIFAGTEVGYLEIAAANQENRDLLARPVRMASAGERFQQWQAWIPWFNSVRMVPADSYDAVVWVAEATPVTPL